MTRSWLGKIKRLFNPTSPNHPAQPPAIKLDDSANEPSDTGKAPDTFSVPVFCYHSWTITGTTYDTNDHIAFEQDLRLFAAKGYEVLPLTLLVEVLRGTVPKEKIAGRKLVGLSFDDGRNFDYHDYEDKQWGYTRSFYNVLKDSRDWLPQFAEGPRATSFVIASPEARAILDHTCGNGQGEWSDEWWSICAQGDLVGIANHGWDHVHDTLPTVRQRENKKGSFFEIDTFEDAEGQIADAQRYIDAKTGGRTLPFFGYPYGHVPSYLRDTYLPKHGERLGLQAAFGTDGGPVREGCNIWDIPRFVCGGHWKTIDELDALLDAMVKGER